MTTRYRTATDTKGEWTEYAEDTGYDDAATWSEDELMDWAWAEICAWYNNEHVQPTDMDTLLAWAHGHAKDTICVLDIDNAMVDMAAEHAKEYGLGTEWELY